MDIFEYKNKTQSAAKRALLSAIILSLTACGGDSDSTEEDVAAVSYDGIWEGVYSSGTEEQDEKLLYMIVKENEATIIYRGYNLATTGSLEGDAGGFSLDGPNTNFNAGLSGTIYLRQETLEAEVTDLDLNEFDFEVVPDQALKLSYFGELSVDDSASNGLGTMFTGIEAFNSFELGFIENPVVDQVDQVYTATVWKTDLMAMSIQLDEVVGEWHGDSVIIDTDTEDSVTLTFDMVVDSEGIITGSDSEGCGFSSGSAGVPDETVNIVEFSIDANLCPVVEGGQPLPALRDKYLGQGFFNEAKDTLTIGLVNSASTITMTMSRQ